MLVRELGKLGRLDLGGEALHHVIRGVDLHQQAGFGADRLGIILEMRAVGRADLAQGRTGPRHDVRHAEGAADLDQLAARDDGLATSGEGVEHEQHGRGVVVDEDRILGPGQFPHEIADMRVAFAALSGLDDVFEIGRCPHRRDHCLDRLLGQQRHAADLLDRGGRRPAIAAQALDRLPDRIGRGRPSMTRDGELAIGAAQHGIDRWRAEMFGLVHQAPSGRRLINIRAGMGSPPRAASRPRSPEDRARDSRHRPPRPPARAPCGGSESSHRSGTRRRSRP